MLCLGLGHYLRLAASLAPSATPLQSLPYGYLTPQLHHFPGDPLLCAKFNNPCPLGFNADSLRLILSTPLLPHPTRRPSLLSLQSPLALHRLPVLFPLPQQFHPITNIHDGGSHPKCPGTYDQLRLPSFHIHLVLWNKHLSLGVARGSEVADLLPLIGYVAHHFKIDLYYLPIFVSPGAASFALWAAGGSLA